MDQGIKVDEKLHRHNLFNNEENALWYCDCLVINTEACRGNQTTVCKNWPCRKFSCKQGCIGTFCEKCVAYYQIPEKFFFFNFPIYFLKSPKVEINVPEHPDHSLVFLSCLPIKWCCFYGKQGKCARNHNEELFYRNNAVFACLKCQFYICDKDGSRFMIKKNEISQRFSL